VAELLVVAIKPQHGPHRKLLFHCGSFSRCQGNKVSTQMFPSNVRCTAGCLRSCYLAMGLHVTVFWTSDDNHLSLFLLGPFIKLKKLCGTQTKYQRLYRTQNSHWKVFSVFIHVPWIIPVSLYIAMCMSDCRRGFGLDIGFNGHSNTQLVITLNYRVFAYFHTLQITIAHRLVFSVYYQTSPGNGF
jgi:hypothetical protein